MDIVGKKDIKGSPLIIEKISSNRQIDLQDKLKLYERYGANEYWTINPSERSILVFNKEITSLGNKFSQGEIKK